MSSRLPQTAASLEVLGRAQYERAAFVRAAIVRDAIRASEATRRNRR